MTLSYENSHFCNGAYPPQEHYCIALGINDRDGCFADFGFQQPKPEMLRLPGGKEITLN